MREQLRASERQVATLAAEMLALSDRKDAEMGRIESGAIRALDETINADQQRIASLRDALADAETATQAVRDELETERQRSLRLQGALHERDDRMAAMTKRLDDMQRQAGR